MTAIPWDRKPARRGKRGCFGCGAESIAFVQVIVRRKVPSSEQRNGYGPQLVSSTHQFCKKCADPLYAKLSEIVEAAGQ